MPRTLKAGGKNSPLPPAFTKLTIALLGHIHFVPYYKLVLFVVSHEAKAEVAL